MQVVLEAIAVGAITAPFLLIFMSALKPRSISEFTLAGFLLGFMVHITFEIFGGNAWFCKYGCPR